MISLITVNAVRGVGDRALLLGIPLYLKDEIGMGTGGIAFHVALFTALAIVAGPILGWLSDRFGRKPMIVLVMAASVIPPLWMVAVGEGIGFTGAVALFGAFLFSVNSLTQAAAMDLAAEHGLEGSAVGLLWGVGDFRGLRGVADIRRASRMELGRRVLLRRRQLCGGHGRSLGCSEHGC